MRAVKSHFRAISEPYFGPRISPETLSWATLETFDPFPGTLPLWGDVSRYPDKQFAFASAWQPEISLRLAAPPNRDCCQSPSRTLRVTRSHLFQTRPFTRNEPDNRPDIVPHRLLSAAVTPLRVLRGNGLSCHLPVYLPVARRTIIQSRASHLSEHRTETEVPDSRVLLAASASPKVSLRSAPRNDKSLSSG